MDWADLTNAIFELTGATLNWMNVVVIWKQKKVRGVYVPAWILFTFWGFWNLYFYGPHLGQWLSWSAGLVMVFANTVWVVLAIRYRRN